MPHNNYENSAEVGLVFYSNPMPLEKLAFYRIALALWRHELFDYRMEHNLPSPDDVAKKFYLQHCWSINSYLRNTIAKCSRQIRNELIAFRNFEDKWFADTFVNDDDTWIKYFDELVWSGEDYSIDYVNTCLNLLLSHRLSNEEKFAFVCVLCMEKHVEELWSVISSSSKSVDDVFNDRVPWPLQYWIDRMRNLVNGDDISNNFDNLFRFTSLNRWAIEYFWQYLSFASQVYFFRPFTLNENYKYLKYLLPKLSVENLQKILTSNGIGIVKALIVKEECRPLALLFWNQVKHMFTSNQFFDLVKWMLISEAETHKWCEEEAVLLCHEIWFHAPEQWKDDVLHLLSVNNSSFVSATMDHEHYRDVSILRMVLSKASLEQKKKIWSNNWFKFCSSAKMSDMMELMELCLPDANERIEFKRQEIMKNKDVWSSHCAALLRDFRFCKFNDFLKFCSTDFNSHIELKLNFRNLLFREEYDRWCNLNYIDVDEFITAHFKNKYSSLREFLLDLKVQLHNGDFAAIESFVIAFSSSKKELLEWKEDFKHVCYLSITKGYLHKLEVVHRWNSIGMMSWYLPRRNETMEFKQLFRELFGNVFEVFFERCCSYIESEGDTRRVSEIFYEVLNSCLDTDDLARFKRKCNIEANPNDDVIHGVLFGKRRRCE